jgi:hypothetical protein
MVTDDQDLVEQLALTAADAVRKRRAAIEAGARNLHGVMVEIGVANGGEVLDVQSHLSWKDVIRNARRAG